MRDKRCSDNSSSRYEGSHACCVTSGCKPDLHPGGCADDGAGPADVGGAVEGGICESIGGSVQRWEGRI